jgi:hypothetical protein
MIFESTVLNKVSEVLGLSDRAGFYHGTLFVECNEPQARSIYHRLTRDYPGCIRISVVDAEYAFDFVVPAGRPVAAMEEIYSPYLGAL